MNEKSQKSSDQKKLKANSVSNRAQRKRKIAQDGVPSIVPWPLVIKWLIISATTLIIAIALGYGAYRIVTAPPPIELDRCPTITELAGTVHAIRGGQLITRVEGDRLLPAMTLELGSSSSIRFAYPDGSVVALYSGTIAKLADDYSNELYLKKGNAFTEVKDGNQFTIENRFGTVQCETTLANTEVARSRCRVEVETGRIVLRNRQRTRRVVILANSWGEVGTGADASGIKSSEANETIVFPGLEVEKLTMFDAGQDRLLSAFDPLHDGAIYFDNQEGDPHLDFRVTLNSEKAVQLDIDLKRIEGTTLIPVLARKSEPVAIERPIFSVFGLRKNGDALDYLGHVFPPGDYILKITPFALTKIQGFGNGRSMTIRFNIDAKQDAHPGKD